MKTGRRRFRGAMLELFLEVLVDEPMECGVCGVLDNPLPNLRNEAPWRSAGSQEDQNGAEKSHHTAPVKKVRGF